MFKSANNFLDAIIIIHQYYSFKKSSAIIYSNLLFIIRVVDAEWTECCKIVKFWLLLEFFSGLTSPVRLNLLIRQANFHFLIEVYWMSILQIYITPAVEPHTFFHHSLLEYLNMFVNNLHKYLQKGLKELKLELRL